MSYSRIKWETRIHEQLDQAIYGSLIKTNLIGEGSGSFHDSFKWTKKIILEFIIWQFTLFEVFYWQLTKWVQSKRGFFVSNKHFNQNSRVWLGNRCGLETFLRNHRLNIPFSWSVHLKRTRHVTIADEYDPCYNMRFLPILKESTFVVVAISIRRNSQHKAIW